MQLCSAMTSFYIDDEEFDDEFVQSASTVKKGKKESNDDLFEG